MSNTDRLAHDFFGVSYYFVFILALSFIFPSLSTPFYIAAIIWFFLFLYVFWKEAYDHE